MRKEKGWHALQRKATFTSETEVVYIDLVTGYMMREGNALKLEVTQQEYNVLVEYENPFDRIDYACDISLLNNDGIGIVCNDNEINFGE